MKDYLVPVLLLLSSALTLGRKEDSYGLLLEGAEEGLRLLKTIIPALVVLLSAVSMLRSSGAMALLENLLAPLFLRLGIPKECALLVLIRPVSGSAALAVGTDLMRTYGVDSAVGRTAALASSIEPPSLDVMVPTASFREESVFFASESVMPTTLGMLTFCFILMTILTRVPFVILLPGSGLWEMMISDGLSGSLPFSTAPIVSPSLSRRSFA